MRPLSPVPIVGLTALVAAVAWSSAWLDDLAGVAVLVAVGDLLLWLGLRGDPDGVPSVWARVAIAIGGAVPAAATVLTFIPWFADGDGMQGLAVVVGMLVLGVPLTIASFAVVLFVMMRGTRAAALDRVLVIAGASVALGWFVAILWAAVGGGSTDVAVNLLAFPGFATAALALPLLERRRITAARVSSRAA